MKILKRIEYFEIIAELFKFKTVLDEQGNEFVLLAQSNYDFVENIGDRTEFESLENHIHLLDNIKKKEFDKLIPVAKILGQTLLYSLKIQFPDKKFMVFVSLYLKDSMIIRFHQKWENEEPYYNPIDFNGQMEKVFAFET